MGLEVIDRLLTGEDGKKRKKSLGEETHRDRKVQGMPRLRQADMDGAQTAGRRRVCFTGVVGRETAWGDWVKGNRESKVRTG